MDKKKLKIVSIIIISTMIIIGCCRTDKSQISKKIPILKGEYLGQNKPGSVPELFAPGVVSTPYYENSITFTPDGNEVYFALASIEVGRGNLFVIISIKRENMQWTRPQVASFSGKYVDGFPFITPDGRQLYFASYRPIEENKKPKKDWDIWVVEQTDHGWSDPKHLGANINTNNRESSPTVTTDGTLYFKRSGKGGSKIYYSRLINGHFEEAKMLSDSINSKYSNDHPYIAPDESYILFSSFRRPDGYGEADIYISFKNRDGSWSEATNLGDKINSRAHENCPIISPDSQYFFFNSYVKDSYQDYWATPLTYDQVINKLNEIKNGKPNIYWVESGVIKALKRNE